MTGCVISYLIVRKDVVGVVSNKYERQIKIQIR